jgi:hypothetical protein
VSRDPDPDPAVAYGAARQERERGARAARRRARQIANARLAVFLAGVLAAWLAATGPLSWAWVGLVALVFAGLVLAHDGVLATAARERRAAAFHADGLARLAGRWAELPYRGPAAGRPAHLYADDLDCLGPGSLFHRISTARTHAGEERLAAWLLAPASPESVRARQCAVAELRPRLDLREQIALRGEEAHEAVDSSRLARWGEGAFALPQGRGWAWLRAWPAVTIGLGVAGWFGAGPLPALASLGVQIGLAWRLRARVRSVLTAVETPVRELVLLSELLSLVESQPFEAPLLRELRSVWCPDGADRASRRVASLRLRLDLLDARRNQLFAPIAGLLLWSTQLAFALEAWRRENGARLRGWLEALGTLEALGSLANLAYERPEDVFPELLEEDAVRLEAEGLGHPLLSAAACVRNDLSLGGDQRLLVVSGSNMSGKSTLLRALGVNVALALAGAPVCARRLALSRVELGASVQLRDSLLAGESRFYAEIQRLRGIFARADTEGAPPVLFLLDEILHGTNAQERRAGAEQVVRALLARGAAGLVTTHDLALAEMVDSFSPPGRNVHFADQIREGALCFDYRLRPGIAQQGNALALMRAIGLPVEVPA